MISSIPLLIAINRDLSSSQLALSTTRSTSPLIATLHKHEKHTRCSAHKSRVTGRTKKEIRARPPIGVQVWLTHKRSRIPELPVLATPQSQDRKHFELKAKVCIGDSRITGTVPEGVGRCGDEASFTVEGDGVVARQTCGCGTERDNSPVHSSRLIP